MVFSSRVCKNIEKGKYPGAYVFPPEKGIETRRSVTGLDFALLYPSLIIAYNLSLDKIILTHEECKTYNKFEKKGLYPVVLEDLSNKRLELKACLTTLEKKRQHLGKIINLKQKALKVYMNTFYGEAGNSKSPIFL
ncbi:7831_t:CDS:2, partial [Funneliformis geosporum]